MASRLYSVVIDCADPSSLGRWWADVLSWKVTYEEPDEIVVEPPDGERLPGLVFVPVPEAKSVKNRVHLDLATHSEDHFAAEVARIRGLGARPADIGQGDTPWVVLTDPEGNEFCVLNARERYAGTGAIAAIVMDAVDPVAQARFWVEATGWVPAGDDTSLRAPDGGGPFLEMIEVHDAKVVKDRVHLDVAPEATDDQAAEVARLEAAGARRVDVGQGEEVTWVVLADPEDHEFCVLRPR